MSGHGEKVSRKKEQVIAALLTCDSITAAAAESGIAEVTLHSWLKQDGFQAAYREARRPWCSKLLCRCNRRQGKRWIPCAAVMKDTEATASAKVSAAKAILETAIKAVELEGLEARIEVLEQVGKDNDHDA